MVTPTQDGGLALLVLTTEDSLHLQGRLKSCYSRVAAAKPAASVPPEMMLSSLNCVNRKEVR